jgi:ribosomal protein S18 acetylase RimI-like enzyme
MIEIYEEAPTAMEAINLYISVGWGDASHYSQEKWSIILANTSSIFTAREDGELVGMIRLQSDIYHETYIPDVVVHPHYQGQGIGTALLKAGLKRFPETSFYACSFNEGRELFRGLGFKEKSGLKAMSLKNRV